MRRVRDPSSSYGSLKDMTAAKVLEKVIESIEKLPSPSFVVQRIISVCSKPDASSEEVARALLMDASLSARVLKLANSAYYGIPRKITTLSEAVMILGFKTVRNIALSVFTYDMIFKNQESVVDRKKLWTHFLYTAIVSETVAEVVGYPLKEEVFVAGLLHDIGKVVYDYVFPKLFETMVKIAEKGKMNMLDVERELGMPSHELVGKKLLESWNFPDLLVFSTAHHHSVESLSSDFFLSQVSMVQLGDVLANLIARGHSFSWGNPILSPTAMRTLKMKPRLISKILERAKVKISKAEELMEI